jgi:hypothetical protein
MSGVMDHANLIVKVDAMALSALDARSAVDPLLLDLSTLLSNGTGAGQASQMWSDQRTLGPSATENLDLAGVLTNAFGVVLTFTKLKAAIFRALSTNNAANLVQVTRPASNGVPFLLAASDGFALTPGGLALFVWPDATAIPVTAATGDLITVTNGAGTNSVVYDVVLIGTD